MTNELIAVIDDFASGLRATLVDMEIDTSAEADIKSAIAEVDSYAAGMRVALVDMLDAAREAKK